MDDLSSTAAAQARPLPPSDAPAIADATSISGATSITEASSTQRVRVWDLPTRLFHVFLAVAVVGLVITGKTGAMVWHMRLGLFVMALLLFRLAWGVMGGHWSRFASFIYGPSTTLGYMQGRLPIHRQASMDVGHSPLGALSVFALLAVLVAQVATGLVADDEISTTGPLMRFVSAATTSKATGWHKGYGQWLIFGLVGLHVAAIAFYTFVKRRTLVGAMVHGDKDVEVPTTTPSTAPPALLPSSRDDMGSRVLAIVLAAAALALAWWLSRL